MLSGLQYLIYGSIRLTSIYNVVNAHIVVPVKSILGHADRRTRSNHLQAKILKNTEIYRNSAFSTSPFIALILWRASATRKKSTLKMMSRLQSCNSIIIIFECNVNLNFRVLRNFGQSRKYALFCQQLYVMVGLALSTIVRNGWPSVVNNCT